MLENHTPAAETNAPGASTAPAPTQKARAESGLAPEERFYEPWTPRPGDRVRIRISPECQFYEYAHRRRVIDGQTGTVLAVQQSGRVYDYGQRLDSEQQWVWLNEYCVPSESEAAHRVLVETDQADLYGPDAHVGRLTVQVAVLEIEPIEAAP